jgi:hypothetical protein
MHDINYPGSVPSGSPNYSADMGTALSIGSVVMRFPTPVKPATGYSLETRYVAEDSSAGLPVVQRVGSVARRKWSLSWDGNLQHIHWIRLQAFFCTFVRGRQEPFTWFDADGTARTVRLAENRLVVKQLGYDRYSCTLPLLEYL